MAIGPDSERVTWSSHLGPMYEALIVARLLLSNGVEAIAGTTTYTEHEFDRATFHATALMAPFVLGRDAFDIRAAYADMRKRYVPLGHTATSLFDIALHDGTAKSEELPLYRMLCAARHASPRLRIEPVTADRSEPMSTTADDMLKLGYRTSQDSSLFACSTMTSVWSDTLVEEFAERDVKLSLDVDGMYSFDQALSLGEEFWTQAGWEFFEAPLPDTDLSRLQGAGGFARSRRDLRR